MTRKLSEDELSILGAIDFWRMHAPENVDTIVGWRHANPSHPGYARAFSGSEYALRFHERTSSLLHQLYPRYPTLDLSPLTDICRYVLAWQFVGADDWYIPTDDDLWETLDRAMMTLDRIVSDLIGYYSIGRITFRESELEIVFDGMSTRFDEPAFRFIQELANAKGRPVPFSRIQERHPAVMAGANSTRLAGALLKAFPDLPLRSEHAGYVLDL
jgi:hypothetical protein